MPAPTSCEDGWASYNKGGKCIKIFSDGFLQYSSAKEYCESMDSTESTASLLSIKNEKEQKTFHEYIFVTSKMESNFWLGLQKTNGLFMWPDGSPPDFANWINGSVESENNSQCVEMNKQGKWLPVSCTRINAFVCERQQSWSLHKIQKSFLEFKRQQLNNPVPIGFLYVQLSEQPDPKAMWPAVKWEDITSKYAGLFFRAEGSGSLKFNDGEQGLNMPRIISVEPASLKTRQRTSCSVGRFRYTEERQQFPWNVKVNYSAEEVRPRNQAVRIWTRIQ